MIDHLGFAVTDYARAKAFYSAALAPLGYAPIMEFAEHQVGGFGAKGKPDLWLQGGEKSTPPIHVAFACETRAQVDAFYQAAMAAGGVDNGPPGIRALYHPDYYGAFVRDPDGHNIEAVCHRPE